MLDNLISGTIYSMYIKQVAQHLVCAHKKRWFFLQELFQKKHTFSTGFRAQYNKEKTEEYES
jgi:hypothetical protein